MDMVYISHELMNEVIKVKSKPSHLSLGTKAIALIVAGKLFLNLASCTAPRELEANFIRPDSTSTKVDSIQEKEAETKLFEQYEEWQREALEEWNILMWNVKVSEWPREVQVPSSKWRSGTVFYVKNPSWYICFDAFGWTNYDEWEPYKVNIPEQIVEWEEGWEWEYQLRVDSYGGERLLATYNYKYKKPETITPLNLQNGELLIDQDIHWPVKIILINLTNNVSQEVVVNKDFKQWEILNVGQYVDLSKFSWKNCALIVKDWSDKIVFDSKFHKN